MDTPADKKAAKKCCLREKRTAAHLPTPIDETATSSTSKNITSAPSQPALLLWDSLSNVCQEAGNHFHKQQLRTAPIAIYPIVEPTTTANQSAPEYTETVTLPAQSARDNGDTVEQVDAKLLCMEQYWAKSRSSPFPESIRSAIADLRLAVEKREREAAWDAAVQVCIIQAAEMDKEEESTKGEVEQRREEKVEPEMRELEKTEDIENKRDQDPTSQKPTSFDWAVDVDAEIGFSPITPNKPNPTPVHSVQSSPNAPVWLPDTIPITFAKPNPIVPVSTIPSIVHGPRDFSALRSDMRNPWGSLNHRRRRPYFHTRYTNLHPKAPNHSDSPPQHPRHSVPSVSPLQHLPNSQSNPYLLPWHPEPFRLAKSHVSAAPQPPINIFQIIQHPRGISSTKPKITKNIPALPILSVGTQEHTRVSHCACGAIFPIHGLDRGSWRLRDPRWRSGRRFSSRFHSRFWDWECGHSHFRGGWM